MNELDIVLKRLDLNEDTRVAIKTLVELSDKGFKELETKYEELENEIKQQGEDIEKLKTHNHVEVMDENTNVIGHKLSYCIDGKLSYSE